MVQELFIGLHARLALPGMLDVVRTWRPDVVVRETLEFASALAAEREGIPQVRVGIHLDSDTDADPRLLGVATPALDLLRPEIGLEPDPEAAAIRDSPVLTLAPASTSGAAEALRFRDAARRRRRRRASCPTGATRRPRSCTCRSARRPRPRTTSPASTAARRSRWRSFPCARW